MWSRDKREGKERMGEGERKMKKARKEEGNPHLIASDSFRIWVSLRKLESICKALGSTAHPP